MYVVEYQKRGLPLEVDSTICAELPPDGAGFQSESEKEQAKRLLSIVLKCKIHGPCGSFNPRSPCMVNGKCSKGYPKPYSNETSWNQRSSSPFYRRRSKAFGGHSAIVGDYVVDNRWVVPWIPYLLLKNEAHINVEASVSPFAAKYLFLYINKVN